MFTNCHTYYSLKYGILSPQELLQMAMKNGVTNMAVTDINSTTACLEFIKEAPTYGIKPIVGADIRNGNDQCFICLARNNNGYYQINKFISEHLHIKKPFPELPPSLEDVYFIIPFEKALLLEIKNLKENWFIGISTANYNKLRFSKLLQYPEKLVLQQPVTFRSQQDFNVHRLLRCIDLNILLSKLPTKEQGFPNDRMQSPERLREIFADHPHIIANAENLLAQCSVSFGFYESRENQNQNSYLGTTVEDFEYLEKLCEDRISRRYKTVTPEITARIKKELDAIKQMDFVSYFLINYDIIQYARKMDYPYIGRGSGANSVVAYILGITNVDPIELDLYFERFINLYRTSPPDFDIDFSWKDRDDVTRYIFERYPNTALMGTYVTFQYRAVIRELAKVFGLPKAEIDDFIAGKKRNPGNDKYFNLVIKYGSIIQGFPNYLSVHSGGIVILKNPVHWYCATFLPPKDFQTLFIDMHIAEAVGIFKFDILAQRGLSKIKDAIELVRENQPDAEILDIEDVEVFKKDPEINTLLKKGDCMGVFYVESPAMRSLMIKLQTDDYLGLVAASSIIRPGVNKGGMKNEYILRHRDPERRKTAHPVLYEIMPETYGVMVYQEDVLKVAHIFAGLSLGEADVLRRGMSGKGRSKKEFEKLQDQYFKNCKEKGYPEQLINDVWEQISAFAGYAFAKGHSASYAVESYQSLYLKRYFPLEFMTAVLNNGGGFYNYDTYINEIRRCGGTVEAPCINNSDHGNCIKGTIVFLGFGMVKDLEHRTIQKLLTERQLYGNFKSFNDFTERCSIGIEQVMILIRIKAFRCLQSNKFKLMWNAHLLANAQVSTNAMPTLFKQKKINYTLPEFSTNLVMESYDNLELLGFTLIDDFAMVDCGPYGTLTVKDFPQYVNKTISIVGKLVTSKSVKTSKGDVMKFNTFLDREGECFDTVHFPDVVQRFPDSGYGIYLIKGKVIDELGYLSIECIGFHKLGVPQNI